MHNKQIKMERNDNIETELSEDEPQTTTERTYSRTHTLKDGTVKTYTYTNTYQLHPKARQGSKKRELDLELRNQIKEYFQSPNMGLITEKRTKKNASIRYGLSHYMLVRYMRSMNN